MEAIADIAARLKQAKPNRNIHSAAHALADEISKHFGEGKLFARYLGVINRVGVQAARVIFSEVKDSAARQPGRLFMWKCSRKARERQATAKVV